MQRFGAAGEFDSLLGGCKQSHKSKGTCIAGRSMKLRSVLSSPSARTGTSAAPCCSASRTKPAPTCGPKHISGLAVLATLGSLPLCRTEGRPGSPACMRAMCRGGVRKQGMQRTLVLGVDNKLPAAQQAPRVHQLRLPAGHQDHRATLPQRAHKGAPRHLPQTTKAYSASLVRRSWQQDCGGYNTRGRPRTKHLHFITHSMTGQVQPWHAESGTMPGLADGREPDQNMSCKAVHAPGARRTRR